MNSGELGSVSEAAEVSVEVSECSSVSFTSHVLTTELRIQTWEEAEPDLTILASTFKIMPITIRLTLKG